ncbi:MAG: acyl dehydratase [Alphaproteobacteria bacterium]|nr:MAG: acyl dehydratase [Alphaproteobacteria bacterium]
MQDPHPAEGRSITVTDPMDPARAAALHATLGLDGPPPGAGDPLPPFWHWVHFWDIHPPARLGRDGHPRPGAEGVLIPDTGLPRRMWAGGRLEWLGPLPVGAPATRRSTVLGIARKQGRSGPLCFVTLRHEITGAAGPAVIEEQDIVYRPDPQPGETPAPARPAPTDETAAQTFHPDSTQLFRYSALTFNGHRIHYDLDYCREVEGYPGLVVHGPLMAQRLIALADRLLGGIRRFAFRAQAPVFHFESFTACARPVGEGLGLWVRAGADGRLAMTAEAA